MKVSELKKKLRPLFKDRLKGMHGGWNNIQSDEKGRKLKLSLWNIEPSDEFQYRKLEADVNATTQANLPDCDIHMVVGFGTVTTGVVGIETGEVQS